MTVIKFETEEDFNAFNSAMNTLLGYPNGLGTLNYTQLIYDNNRQDMYAKIDSRADPKMTSQLLAASLPNLPSDFTYKVEDTTEEITVDYTSNSNELICSLKKGSFLADISIVIDTDFDAGTTLTMGTVAQPTKFASELPLVEGSIFSDSYKLTEDEDIIVTLSESTTGSMTIKLTGGFIK